MENKESFRTRLQPYFAPSVRQKIQLAYILAKYGHRAQTRKEEVDGKPLRYFEHVRRVALIVMDEVKLYEENIIISALLHDSLEDCEDLTEELLEYTFGPDVTHIVKYLSKTPKIGYTDRLRNCTDWKILVLKACDRLDNLRSMGPETSLEFQKKQVIETREKYIPIFERMLTITPGRHVQNVAFLHHNILRELDTVEKATQ